MIASQPWKSSPAAISVVIPAHNESENLPTLINEIHSIWTRRLSHEFDSYELLVIDDASTDATRSVLADLSISIPSLTTRRLAKRSGQSTALVAGFDAAAGDIIVTLDADLQNDPADIPLLLDALADHDMAIGWRRDRKDTLGKRVISKVANSVRNFLTSETVKDTGCGLKAFRAECVRHMPRFDGMHRFLPTLAKMQGYTVVEIPVRHRPRIKGRTHYNLFNRSIKPMADLLAVRWLQKRSVRYRFAQEHSLVEV